MKIFILEYVTGGGMAGLPLPAILADAEIIRRAQLDDLAAVPGIDLLTLLDSRLAPDFPPAARLVRVGPGEFDARFAQALTWADAVWVTAPETDGVLEALSRRVLDAGCCLLGCAPEAVRVAASKRTTARVLEQAGIATVPVLDHPGSLRSGPVVVKPDDGAGCESTRCFTRHDEAVLWGQSTLGARAVYQPLFPGEPLSLSLLCAGASARLLAVNRQQVRLRDGWFRFDGVSVAALRDADGEFALLARRVAQALPGLWGHVGVDLVAGPGGVAVVEINPRATVSYAGLRCALGINPALALLRLPRPDGTSGARGAGAIVTELDHVGATA